MPQSARIQPLRERWRSERGVSLIIVAISIFMLTGFLVVVLDYGVMWLARRQAQNAADAGALAGAVAMAFDDPTYPPDAGVDSIPHQSAVVAAQLNEVFNEAGGVSVKWECPAHRAGGKCIRVDVHRDGEDVDGVEGTDSTPLPVYFAHLFGIESQQVRATASAWVLGGNTVNCLRPFVVSDKWVENNDPATPLTFDRWVKDGSDTIELDDKDTYTPPTADSPGTGYTVEADYGTQLNLKGGTGQPSWYQIVHLPVPGSDPVDPPNPNTPGHNYAEYFTGSSPAQYSDWIFTCVNVPISIGDYLPTSSGDVDGPTRTGVENLVALDDGAEWDEDTQSITGSCAPGCAPFSPRIVPIGVFDFDEYQWRESPDGDYETSWTAGEGPGGGEFACPGGTTACLRIVNIIGFFIEGVEGNGVNQRVKGRIINYPGDASASGETVDDEATFIKVIQLIR